VHARTPNPPHLCIMHASASLQAKDRASSLCVERQNQAFRANGSPLALPHSERGEVQGCIPQATHCITLEPSGRLQMQCFWRTPLAMHVAGAPLAKRKRPLRDEPSWGPPPYFSTAVGEFTKGRPWAINASWERGVTLKSRGVTLDSRGRSNSGRKMTTTRGQGQVGASSREAQKAPMPRSRSWDRALWRVAP
jgi:hypothetical protein